MEEKRDLRVVKTERALVAAMVKSLESKQFEDITVQSVCQLAMVRRATFYTHFADKYELFAFTIRQVYREFPSFAQVQKPTATKDVYRTLIADAINFLSENQALVRSLVNSQLMPVMLNIIRTEIEADILLPVERDMQFHQRNQQSPQLVINFYLYGIFGTFLWWVREGYPISKEALIQQISQLMDL